LTQCQGRGAVEESIVGTPLSGSPAQFAARCIKARVHIEQGILGLAGIDC
jgi:hypothetical protein